MKNNFFENAPLCQKLFNSLSFIAVQNKRNVLPKLNLLELEEGKNILIFGASVYGENVYDILKKKYNIIAYIDNSKDKLNESINGVSVNSPSEIAKLNYDLIFIASQQVRDIYQQLVNDYGVDKEKISY